MKNLNYQKQISTKEQLVEHLNTFEMDLKFSVGIWCLNPCGSRFHESYVDSISIEDRLEMAARLADDGLRGIEAHYPAEVNEDNLHLYQKLEENAGVKLVGVPFSHFYDRAFEFGSLSNPYPEVREQAIDIAAKGLALVKEAGANCAVSWPGIDGYTYSLGTPFLQMWDYFEASMAEAMDRTPGVRIAIEPKPYEPAPNNIYRTTAEGLLAAQRIERRLTATENRALLDEGYALVGLNPEIGHVRMGYEDCAAAYSLVCYEGRLMHTHWNSQPLGNYDQDLNVGVVEWSQAEALLYALTMTGYDEWIGLDVFPERMPADTAVRLNMRALRKMRERIARLPHEKLIEAWFDPAANRGEIERILIDNM